jgi:hypothetical protein
VHLTPSTTRFEEITIGHRPTREDTMKKQFLIQAIAATVLVAAPLAAHAFPIASMGEGLQVFVTGTDAIVATYQGNSASYSNDLFLALDGSGNPIDDGDYSNDLFIFNNHLTPVGSTSNLGSFAVGTELIFYIYVNNTQDRFFTGPWSRNPDRHAHARVEDSWQPSETLVSFEDLYEGPYDYNDLSFSFTNTSTIPTPPNAVPEPSTLLLFGVGIAGLTALGRKKLK